MQARRVLVGLWALAVVGHDRKGAARIRKGGLQHCWVLTGVVAHRSEAAPRSRIHSDKGERGGPVYGGDKWCQPIL